MTAPVSSTTGGNSALQNYLTQQAQQQAAQAAAVASGTNTNSSNSLAQATSASTIGSNFNTFINILTTQLKNQDPTNASDPNQFTQELVQFAGVEQQLNTNNDLQTLINLQKNSGGSTAALGYIGGYVQATTTTDQLTLQNGSSEFGYTLATPASNVAITVQNSSGQTVATLTGSVNSGTNYVKWDGRDSSGNQLADGTYTYALTATNPDGTTQTPTSNYVIGLVNGVTTNSDGTTNLTLGGISVPTASITSVFAANSLPAATTVPKTTTPSSPSS